MKYVFSHNYKHIYFARIYVMLSTWLTSLNPYVLPVASVTLCQKHIKTHSVHPIGTVRETNLSHILFSSGLHISEIYSHTNTNFQNDLLRLAIILTSSPIYYLLPLHVCIYDHLWQTICFNVHTIHIPASSGSMATAYI